MSIDFTLYFILNKKTKNGFSPLFVMLSKVEASPKQKTHSPVIPSGVSADSSTSSE